MLKSRQNKLEEVETSVDLCEEARTMGLVRRQDTRQGDPGSGGAKAIETVRATAGAVTAYPMWRATVSMHCSPAWPGTVAGTYNRGHHAPFQTGSQRIGAVAGETPQL